MKVTTKEGTRMQKKVSCKILVSAFANTFIVHGRAKCNYVSPAEGKQNHIKCTEGLWEDEKR